MGKGIVAPEMLPSSGWLPHLRCSPTMAGAVGADRALVGAAGGHCHERSTPSLISPSDTEPSAILLASVGCDPKPITDRHRGAGSFSWCVVCQDACDRFKLAASRGSF